MAGRVIGHGNINRAPKIVGFLERFLRSSEQNLVVPPKAGIDGNMGLENHGPPQQRIYRQQAGSSEQEVIKVDYASIKKNAKPDVLLQAFDIIDVPEAGAFSKGRIGSTLISAVTGSLQNAFSSVGYSLPTRVIY